MGLVDDSNARSAHVQCGGQALQLRCVCSLRTPRTAARETNQPLPQDFHTVPQPGLGHRAIHEPRGKVLGGSSSINAMVYIRGHALDFERWAHDEGARGWDYASVLPYFKRAQNHSLGADAYRGAKGPLQVKQVDPVTNPLFDVFEQAGVQAGYRRTTDVNGYSQEGFGKFDMTIGPDGTRWSAAKAYLRTAPRDRLTVVTKRTVKRVALDGKRAIGVVLDDDSVLRADREVVLCAGAFGSPQLLMLSGIGPGGHLKEAGVGDAVVDNAGVGANLQDHLEVYLQYKCTQPVTLYPVGNWTLRYLHRRVAVGLEWFARGTGLGASNQFETGGFVRSRAGVRHPDVQYHFIPGAVLGQLEFLPLHAFQVHVGTLRPTSRGSVRLASLDPKASLRIDPNFLGTEEDVRDMRAAARLADEVVQQAAFAPFRGERIRPSAAEVGSIQSDDVALDAWLKASSHSAYHVRCAPASCACSS